MLKYLATTIHTDDIEQSVDFYCGVLGMIEVRRREDPAISSTSVFVAGPGDMGRSGPAPTIELRSQKRPNSSIYGHLVFEVDDLDLARATLDKAGYATTLASGSAAVTLTDGVMLDLVEQDHTGSTPAAPAPEHVARSSTYYLHTTIFTADLDKALAAWMLLDMRVVRELVVPGINARAAFLSGAHDEAGGRSERFAPTIALVERPLERGPAGISHICFRVEDLYATCQSLLDQGRTLKLPPRDGFRAMIRTPEGAVIEFHQAGERKSAQEPWLSMADSA